FPFTLVSISYQLSENVFTSTFSFLLSFAATLDLVDASVLILVGCFNVMTDLTVLFLMDSSICFLWMKPVTDFPPTSTVVLNQFLLCNWMDKTVPFGTVFKILDVVEVVARILVFSFLAIPLNV